MDPHPDLRLTLLNPWQRGFPLEREPFAHIASIQGLTTDEVLAGYARLQSDGALSRIGGVFAGNAGGAALLAAMAVPPERLDAVAAVVSSHPGVNHNYQREHHFNLWFVMTGQDDAAVRAAMRSLEEATGLPALQLRMQRAYRIDLGFDLRGSTAPAPMAAAREATPVLDADRPLAALLEDGLPLVPRPYDAWAQALGRTPESVLHTLQQWLDQGTVRRIGAIVRHHELGFDANDGVARRGGWRIDSAGRGWRRSRLRSNRNPGVEPRPFLRDGSGCCGGNRSTAPANGRCRPLNEKSAGITSRSTGAGSKGSTSRIWPIDISRPALISDSPNLPSRGCGTR